MSSSRGSPGGGLPAVALLAAPLLAAPADAAEAPRAYVLEQVWVEAAAPARVGEVAEEEHTGAVTRHQGEALERAESVGDVLDRGAGADVRRFGAPGSYSTVSLRGADSDQVAVYLDGMLLNQAAGGGVDLAELELAHVRSIQVYRGTTPVQLGHALPGGSVNIQTPAPGGKARGRLKAGAGSFGERVLSGIGMGEAGGWELFGAATYQQADNDFPYTDDRGTADNTADDREVRRENAQVRQTSGLLKLGRELGGGQRLDTLVRHLDKRQGLPTWDNADVDTRLDTRETQARLRWRDRRLGGPWVGMLGVHGRLREETYDDRADAVGLGEQHGRYRTRAAGAEGYVERLGAWNTSILRLDATREQYTARDLLADEQTNDATRDRLQLAAANKAHLLERALLLSVTLRHRRIDDTAEGSVGSLGRTAFERDVQRHWTTGALGARLALGAGWSVRGNAARYVRTPSFYELYGDRGFVLGNPALAAEEGLNTDLGVDWRGRWRRDWLPGARLSLSAFRSRVEHMIVRTFDARGVGRAENVGEATVRGVEAAIDLELTAHLRFEFHGTIQDSENHSELAAFEGKQLPGVPGYSYGTLVEYRRPSWSVFHAFDAEGNRYYDSANLLEAEDQAVHDAGVSYRLGRWELRVVGRNLTDAVYEDFNGHPRPGRSWHAEVRYGFGGKSNE